MGVALNVDMSLINLLVMRVGLCVVVAWLGGEPVC